MQLKIFMKDFQSRVEAVKNDGISVFKVNVLGEIDESFTVIKLLKSVDTIFFGKNLMLCCPPRLW